MATKQSLYVPDEMLREIMSESIRLDRSLSWIVQAAWRVARGEVSRFPPAALPPATTGAASSERAAGAEHGPSAQVLEFLRGKFENTTH